MVTGGLNFVIAAYAVTGAGLIALTLIVVLRLIHWSARARELDKSK